MGAQKVPGALARYESNAFVRLGNEGTIPDGVLHRIELDLEETRPDN